MAAVGLGLILTAAVLPPLGAQDERPSGRAPEEGQKILTAYLGANYRSPQDYIVARFKDRDIIFIGERHHVGQYLEFLQSLLPILHANGIRNLGYEFANSADQGKIDRLVVAETYDAAAAAAIVGSWRGDWRKREYIDVFRAAWELNRKLPKGAPRFRIVALNTDSRLDVQGEGKGHRETNRARNMVLGGHVYDVLNTHWARVIAREVIAKGEKALIWAGACHTPTRFRLDRRPRLEHYISAGNFIYNFIGERTAHLALHSSICTGESEMEEVWTAVETAVRAVPQAGNGAGFDTTGTPFGELPLSGIAGWSSGRTAGLTLADLCDGYIYLVPRSEFKPDTPIGTD